MRYLLLILLLASAVSLGGGCASADSVQFEKQVRHWVPLGTPAAEAQQIMEHHNFDCVVLTRPPRDPSGESTLSCKKKPGIFSSMGDWQAEFTIRDGKVTAYSYIDL